MTFVPKVRAVRSGRRTTIMVRQRYHPRGKECFVAYRWRIADVIMDGE